MEKTYVMIKPDGLQRGLIGRIIQRFEDKGLQLMALKMTNASEDVLQEHYAELADRPFFPDLMAYIQSGPVICMCWRGQEAVKVLLCSILKYIRYLPNSTMQNHKMG